MKRPSKVSSDCMYKYFVFSFSKMCSDKKSFFVNVTQAGSSNVSSDSVTASGNAHISKHWNKKGKVGYISPQRCTTATTLNLMGMYTLRIQFSNWMRNPLQGSRGGHLFV